MTRNAALPAILLLVLAGCSGARDVADPSLEPGPDGLEAVPGCDPTRRAVAHHPGGVPAPNASGPFPVPCFVRTGFTSGEPTIGITSTGTVAFGPAVDQILLPRAFAASGPAVALSRDAGATWERVVPNVQGQSTHPTSHDPFLHVDEDTDRIFFDSLLPALLCSWFSWSDDEGATWDHSVSGCMETDHQTIFTGKPTISSTTGYPNVVYRCSLNIGTLSPTSFGATCQRSLDGGRVWQPPGTPAFVTDPRMPGQGDVPGLCNGAVGHGHVDHNGRVYLPKGLCGQPWLAMSDDEGLTWTRVQVSDLGMIRGPGGGDAHDAGVGTDEEGNVYYAWVARDRLPYLSISRDEGRTWGEPIMIGIPGLKESTHPALIMGDGGRLAFAYVGNEDGPGAPFLEGKDCLTDPTPCGATAPAPSGYENATWNGYITVTVDALSDQPTFYSASTNTPGDPLIRGYCAWGGGGCQEMFDFIDIGVGPDGTPWASFVDGCTGACATGDEMMDNDNEGVAGRLWGGPSLYDDSP